MTDSKPADPRETLDQQLVELIYDLLPEDEAAELHRRISSEPDVARAYAEMKLRTDLLAKAARLEKLPVEVRPPAEPEAKPAAGRARLATAAPRGDAAGTRRTANWLVGLATMALVALVGFFYWQPRSPINPQAVASAKQRIADEQVRVEVTGSARLHADVTNRFSVATHSGENRPVAVPVEYLVYSPDGQLLQDGGSRTDEEGRLEIQLPPDLRLADNSRLDVVAIGGEAHHLVSLSLDVEEPQLATHLSLDKPLYRPGETIYYRSLSLSRFGLKADRELPLHFEILDPAGSMVPDSAKEGATLRGVGNGRFDLPPGIAGGSYTLVVRSLDETFPEERREFAVRRYRTPRLKKELEFTRDSYTPGDGVIADFSAVRAEGGAAAGAQLNILVTVDGQPVPVDPPAPQAASDGSYRVEFTLPAKIEQGSGTLAVVVDDGGTRETIAKTIPINLGKVDVRFYPEGGDLVSGLENRVYFHAVDPLGEPVHIEGVLLDEQDAELTAVETGKEGRGAFHFTPRAGHGYRLKIRSPAGVTNLPELPRTTAGRWLVLDTAGGVFAADEPIRVDVLSTKNKARLVATAVCRGVQVGRLEFTALPDEPGSNKKSGRRTAVTLPVAPEAAGVVRVTVYDAAGQVPQPIAERLVYRKPARELNVELIADGGIPAFSPGEAVKLTLQVADETGDAVPAVLGVAVVDDALLNLADDKSPQMTTHFLLATEIEKPEDLEDANFFLSGDPEAAESLDLLLGTQGWRRFASQSLEELATLVAAGPGVDGPADPAWTELNDRREALTQLVSLEGEDRPPVTSDNGSEVAASYAAAIDNFSRQRAAMTDGFGWVVLMSGAGLLVVLTLLGAFKLAGDIRVWVPAVAAAAVCCLVGITWMGAEPAAEGQIAFRTWSAFSPAEREVAGRGDERSSGEQIGMRVALSEEEGEELEALRQRDDSERSKLARAVEFDEQGVVMDGVAAADPDAAKIAGVLNLFAAGVDKNGQAAVGFALGDGKRRWARVPGRDFGLEGFEALGIAGKARERFANKKFEDEALFFGTRSRWDAGDFDGDFAQLDLAQWAKMKNNLRGQGVMAGGFGGGGGGGGGGFGGGHYAYYEANYEKLLEQFRFPVRVYAHQHRAGTPGVRTDFAETLYWNPLLIADADGRATIEFELSDSVTTFRLRADAHGAGRIGSGGGEVVSRIPFSLEPKIPLEVNAGDRIDLPVAVNNDTDRPLPVELELIKDELLQLAGKQTRQLSLPAASRRREYFSLDVIGQKGEATIEVRGLAGNLSDAVRKPLRIVPPGFPVSDSYAGQLTEDQTLVIPMPEDWVNGSLEVTLQVFPSSLADLQKGLDSILREPSGCFEQTSTSNYPNVLGLLYMQEHDVADPAFTRRAKELLKKGYGRLTSFESPQKGYEWFGGDPGHEALTAYGLMQFRDMSGVWDVDQEMVTRTANWLLDRRDGKGGFQRNGRALDTFGRAPQEITNAYIVWALAEAGQEGIEKEAEHVIAQAKESEDPYLIALAAAAAMKTDRQKIGAELLDRLAGHQQEDGHLEATDGTITRSGGLSMQMETTALAALAWLTEPRMRQNADKAVEWIGSHRQGSGGFGSTQATILALKALIEHAKVSRATVSSGALYVKRGDDEIGRTEFEADQTKTITLDGLEAQIQPGENELNIGLTGDNEMPFALDVSYRTRKPAGDENCPVRLKTELAEEEVAAGATVSLAVELSNVSGEGQPMTLAIIGLPAGLEARVEQLDEFKEAGTFDYYEINARELIFYWRSLSPDAKDADRIAFDLDLVAEIPGRYTGPASRTYLYYTPEQKHWTDPLKVEIARD